MKGDSAEFRRLSLQDKLRMLVDLKTVPGKRRLGANTIAKGINEQQAALGNVPEHKELFTTPQYVLKVLRGETTDVRVSFLQALADYFECDVALLIGHSQDAQFIEQVDTLRRLHRAGVTDLALRLAGLTPESHKTIEAMLERMEHLEGRDRPERDNTQD